MISRVHSATTIGFDGALVDVECDTSQGLPGIVIVGLGNKAIDEAKERVRSAIKNAKLEFPRKRVTINLAPANIPKVGAHFDLPIAIALLIASGQISQKAVDNVLIVGELALDGALRPVRGVITHTETARDHGLTTIILPRNNVPQALLVHDVTVLPVNSLKEVVDHLNGNSNLSPALPGEQRAIQKEYPVTLEDIKGQDQAKRALTIAAAGRHNILFSGPPGAGKTMLARALTSLLPKLSPQEVIEVTKLHNLAGEINEEVVSHRPFRSPHHSTSHVALVGGGKNPRPGEISLAHRGVLFLDELPEYSRQALESLRQPLEDRYINIARANDRVSYPADFMLIATRNPCPCGYAGDDERTCECSNLQIMNYQRKISGPLLDRIDLIVEVSRVDTSTLLNTATITTVHSYTKAILAARERQRYRYQNSETTNTHLTTRVIPQLAHLETSAKQLLDMASSTLKLSARAYLKTIKVARTIADLEESHCIGETHISEALQYRPRAESAE